MAHVTIDEAELYRRRGVERRAADVALLSILGVSFPWFKARGVEKNPGKMEQGIGEACGGRLLKVCGDVYRGALAEGCRTCPGLRG